MKNDNTRLFVLFSIILFLTVTGILIAVVVRSYVVGPPVAEVSPGVEDRYFFKDQEEFNQDPYIERNPDDLSAMLAGPILSGHDPVMGDEQAPVTIVQFGDYTCPYCYEQEAILKTLLNDYWHQVRLMRKDYPLDDKTDQSFLAARAARCAQAQGDFWRYHDLLYQNSDNLRRETYINIAEALELEGNQFINCLDSTELDYLIEDNIEEANALDISGVPFLYVNDQEILGEAGYEDIERLVKVELGNAK